MADNNFSSTMDSMLSGMDRFISSKSVLGEAIVVDKETVIYPIVNVSFGLGACAGVNQSTNKSNGGGGLGAKLSPNAVLVVQKGNVRIIPVKEENKAVRLAESLPDLISRVMGLAAGKSEKLDKAVSEAFDEINEEKTEKAE